MKTFIFTLALVTLAVFAIAKSPDTNYVMFLKQNQETIKNLQSYLLDISDPDSSSYGKYLTMEQLNKELYIDGTEKVTAWLESNKVTCYRVSGDVILVNDTMNNVQRMYNLALNSKFAVVPEYLQSYVLHISGLFKNKKILRENRFSTSQSEVVDNGYTGREVMERLYSFPMKSDANNISIAAVEFSGGGFDQSDINTAQLFNDVHPNKVVGVVGSNPGGGTESKLDMQMIAITGAESQLWYLNYPQSIWVAGMIAKVASMKSPPHVMSISYGWSERSQCEIASCGNLTSEEYVNLANHQFVKLGLLGTTVMVSSGDAGAPGRTAESCTAINPAFPGVSPWVTSVGATFIVANNTAHHNYNTKLCMNFGCANGTSQAPTNFNYTSWTTGGGFGVFTSEGTQKWQRSVVDEYISSGVHLPNETLWNRQGRGFPDVSAIGHMCPVFFQGFPQGVDGTSCSSPVFAGMVALWNQQRLDNGKPPLGFFNPMLYKMANTNPEAFTQTEPGNNHCTEFQCCSNEYGFETGNTQWNPVSGLGTPNFEVISRLVNE
jgi:tripeptidyl-peptidase-1